MLKDVFFLTHCSGYLLDLRNFNKMKAIFIVLLNCYTVRNSMKRNLLAVGHVVTDCSI